IKRSVASFFKHLSNKNIKIIINSCDPNISADYIIKKCKLKENAAADPDEYQSSYFTEKSEKVEPSLPADVFTDGKIHSVSKLMYSAEKISRALNTIPLIEYALTFAGAILIAVPALTGSISIVGNIYVLIIKIICPVLCVLIPAVLPERKQPKEK
ncbi:MAG: hypothetical protein LUG85_09455, partial [Clostridiales bacterium]|nr:hypothetical protein [Clostridiales bacterium]